MLLMFWDILSRLLSEILSKTRVCSSVQDPVFKSKEDSQEEIVCARVDQVV